VRDVCAKCRQLWHRSLCQSCFVVALAITLVVLPTAFVKSVASTRTSNIGTYNSPLATDLSFVNHTAKVPIEMASFAPSMGLTRLQAESLFLAIDGKNTIFKSASSVKGVARALGKDQRLFTAVEINGSPEVVDVQVVTVLDTASKPILENQVVYDSLTCREFASVQAQKWCTDRVLNINRSGLVTATQSRVFSGLRMTVRTFHTPNSANPSIVTIDIAADQSIAG
jgi:hypothetical protein